MPIKKRILHIEPESYFIDDNENEEIENPIGATCDNLMLKANLILASNETIKKIEKLFDELSLTIENISFSPYALKENIKNHSNFIIADLGGYFSHLLFFENLFSLFGLRF